MSGTGGARGDGAALVATARPGASSRPILLYLATLTVLLAFGAPHGGLIDIPVSFLLKNKLRLTADELARFRLVASIPLYLSFAFGIVRDTWNPLGMRDRGFILAFGAASAGLYLGFAFAPISYGALLAAMLLLTSTSLFVASAQNGLASMLGQQHAMSGQISAAWNIFASIPTVAAFLIGGALSDLLESRDADRAVRLLFLLGAAFMSAVAAFAAWKPSAVFADVYRAPEAAVQRLRDLGRLGRHWPIYPALAIWTLWNFAPGSVTPLQYYLQDGLRADDAHWGMWNAIYTASFVPTFIVFGVLCRRVPLRRLLWWGTIVAIPQLVPLLFIESVAGAMIAAVPIGLMGGVATAAYLDLIIRSCPPGLQGTVLMLAGSVYFISTRFGDVLGAILYDRYGGFTVCVVTITIAYALILPVLTLVPRPLIDTADRRPAR